MQGVLFLSTHYRWFWFNEQKGFTVLITVAATVLALFPLALHGGPLWEALCYAQIGGLSFATLVTLFIVPVIYSIFVLDLKVIKWSEVQKME